MIKVSSLPLLAYKVGPNLFDVSSQMHHVSIRDQMHRATVLAEALVEGRQIRSDDQVLIVGAGVAGISAGIVLARHGVHVQVVDGSQEAPFALQRHVHERRVGPYMYEWPLEVHQSQVMPPPKGTALEPWSVSPGPPLPFVDQDPSAPAKLVMDWDQELEKLLGSPGCSMRLQIGIDKMGTNAQVAKWLTAQRAAFLMGRSHARCEVNVLGGVPWKKSKGPVRLNPRFVLLAAGMGSERAEVRTANGQVIKLGAPFWRDDDILRHQCGQANKPKVVVLGGGDGALQDTLRALTGDSHPLDTLSRLGSSHDKKRLTAALERVHTMEVQHAQVSVWALVDHRRTEALASLDKGYAQLAHDLAADLQLRQDVLGLFRTDVQSVDLCIRELYFSKAYALNRFLIHLIEACVKAEPARTAGRARFTVRRDTSVVDVDAKGPPWLLRFDNGKDLGADVVSVRFGPDPSELPGQWLGLKTTDTVNRQELAAIALPLYLAPTL